MRGVFLFLGVHSWDVHWVAKQTMFLDRKVVDGSGDEVGCLKNLEIAFDVVVAFGAVDDGFGGGVPGDFLERERVVSSHGPDLFFDNL